MRHARKTGIIFLTFCQKQNHRTRKTMYLKKKKEQTKDIIMS